MAQKNFDIDDRLANEFKAFCKSRGLSMSYAAGASLLWFMQASPDERERATLKYDQFVSRAAATPPRPRLSGRKQPDDTMQTGTSQPVNHRYGEDDSDPTAEDHTPGEV